MSKKDKTPEEYVNDIKNACEQLGWYIAMNDRKKGISGLVIGRLDYIAIIIDQLENSEDFEIYDVSMTSNVIH